VVGRSGAGPSAFDDYADDDLREVEISEDLVMRACVGSSAAADKMNAASTKCFGADFDLEDFAEDSSADSDDDGLSDQFEKKEMCFYEAAGWSDGSKLIVDNVKALLDGIDASIKSDFDKKVDECNKMTLDSLNRKKRGVEESGSGSLIRKTREADAAAAKGGKSKGKKGKKGGKGAARKGRKGKKGGKGAAKKGRKGKKGGKGRGKKGRKGKKGGKGRGKKGRKGLKGGKGGKRSGKKGGKGKGGKRSGKKGGKGKGGKRSGKKGGKGKGGKRSGKKGGKGKKNGGKKSAAVDETLYMKLWCIDLSLEQSLQTCVENKIKK